MAKQKEIEIEARLVALEFLVAQLFRIHYEQLGLSNEQVAREHTRMRTFGHGITVEGTDDPAMADHMSAEIAEHVQVVLKSVEELREYYRQIREQKI